MPTAVVYQTERREMWEGLGEHVLRPVTAKLLRVPDNLHLFFTTVRAYAMAEHSLGMFADVSL
jgi:hypothetical protein